MRDGEANDLYIVRVDRDDRIQPFAIDRGMVWASR
jgi:hypothetical protein